ncbi:MULTISPECIES: hypothetical protein [unclassified Solwaraspora]|uniref:hypothetical protein n=1 Tax=unclassified Solwaraspora TaxID=2627926 RepID=UPI00248B6E67|nr:MULTISPECIES: hypothetical protein [unclassified Solwaraspora]WBB96191.1 hypothetical protein O7553_23045 [Solwaraspora sp. WMMA2059]WBC19905.1 hypothetical protein O7543_24330 [Solwaraspora sp. WMMA2080]WJK32502.1 hypothetical protein O7610_17195 [Solwaraspora sp. WMMA2065]
MRHLWSFLSGLAAAPLCWVLIAVGQTTSARTIAGWVTDGGYHTATLLAPAAFVFAAGLLLGLLGTLRFSPLGPLTAGLALAAPYVAMFVDPFGARDLIGTPWRLFGEPVVLLQPVENGTLALLGVLLSTAVLSRQRWRSRPATNGTDDDEAGSDAAAAEPLPVRPRGEFDPSLWSLPGGSATTSDDSADAPTGPDRADADRPASLRTKTRTKTTLAAPAGDVRPDGDGLRPARPIPRSSRVIR